MDPVMLTMYISQHGILLNRFIIIQAGKLKYFLAALGAVEEAALKHGEYIVKQLVHEAIYKAVWRAQQNIKVQQEEEQVTKKLHKIQEESDRLQTKLLQQSAAVKQRTIKQAADAESEPNQQLGQHSDLQLSMLAQDLHEGVITTPKLSDITSAYHTEAPVSTEGLLHSTPASHQLQVQPLQHSLLPCFQQSETQSQQQGIVWMTNLFSNLHIAESIVPRTQESIQQQATQQHEDTILQQSCQTAAAAVASVQERNNTASAVPASRAASHGALISMPAAPSLIPQLAAPTPAAHTNAKLPEQPLPSLTALPGTIATASGGLVGVTAPYIPPKRAEPPVVPTCRVLGPHDVRQLLQLHSGSHASSPVPLMIGSHAKSSLCGVLLMPVQSAVRGAFPLNGTYFQVGSSRLLC